MTIPIIQKLSNDIKNNKKLQNVPLAFSRNILDKIDIASVKNIIKYLFVNSSKPREDKRANSAFDLIAQIDYLKSF